MAQQLGPEITTLIWDLDGTLLDSFGLYQSGLTEVLLKYGIAVPTQATLAANFHGSLEDSIDNALGGIEADKLRTIVSEFLLGQDKHYEIVEHNLFADAVDLLRRAHAAGKRQILVTNRAHEGHLRASPRSIVEHSELKDYIDLVICGDDSEHRKPKPEVLGVLYDDIVARATAVIGDQYVDAEFAFKLGCRAVLVSRDGEDPHHLDRLGHDWRAHVSVVKSLKAVAL